LRSLLDDSLFATSALDDSLFANSALDDSLFATLALDDSLYATSALDDSLFATSVLASGIRTFAVFASGMPCFWFSDLHRAPRSSSGCLAFPLARDLLSSLDYLFLSHVNGFMAFFRLCSHVWILCVL
jgi:hypothetical protein